MSLTFGVSAILFAISCKHEVPVGNDPGGTPGNGSGNGNGNGSGNNPPVCTCSPDTVYFQQQVLPIFISNCSLSGCHDAASHQDGVVLTNYQSIMNTGEIEPGDPNDSEVYEKITENDNDDRMPPPPKPRRPACRHRARGTRAGSASASRRLRRHRADPTAPSSG